MYEAIVNTDPADPVRNFCKYNLAAPPCVVMNCQLLTSVVIKHFRYGITQEPDLIVEIGLNALVSHKARCKIMQSTKL